MFAKSQANQAARVWKDYYIVLYCYDAKCCGKMSEDLVLLWVVFRQQRSKLVDSIVDVVPATALDCTRANQHR